MKQYLLLSIFLLASVANASETNASESNASETISWEALRPSETRASALSGADKALLSEIYAYEMASQSRSLSPLEQDGYRLRVALAEKRGLDVTAQVALLMDRQTLSSSVIPNLAIKDVKLAGYLIPLQGQAAKYTQFVLVPNASVCAHTQLPPAGQSVLVNVPAGYELTETFEPVWVEGNIQTDEVVNSVQLSDGNRTMTTGYVINAANIKRQD